MRVIDRETIAASIGEAEALESAETAFRALAEGRVELPPPVSLTIPEVDGEVHVKSGHIAGSPTYAVKIASGFYRNAALGLPTGSGLILVFDARTGFPSLLLADDGYLTDLRTAAAGALAARLLAPEELRRVAVLGSGVQARFQLRALAGVRRWMETVAWSPDPARLRAYCVEMEAELRTPCTPAPSPEQAIKDAALVVTATPSREPLLDASWLAPDCTVIAVGSDSPDKRELPSTALALADKIVVDRLEQCLKLGELHHAVEDGSVDVESVHGELGQILIGEKAAREGDEMIICDLTGVGVQDASIAEVAWRIFGEADQDR